MSEAYSDGNNGDDAAHGSGHKHQASKQPMLRSYIIRHSISNSNNDDIAHQGHKMPHDSWKFFNFFDSSPVRLDDQVASILEGNDYASLCSGGKRLYIGNTHGIVHVVSSSFSLVRSWKAHEKGSITNMKYFESTGLLVTVAEDPTVEPELKVWAVDTIEKKTGIPRCQSVINIQNGRKNFPMTCFVGLEDLSQVAAGFASGIVTLIKGDLIHDRGTKQRTIYSSDEPITGLQFLHVDVTSTLYVATTERLITFVTSVRGQIAPSRTIETAGCGLGCMALSNKSEEVILVREDAIYFYGTTGRGSCWAYDGPKTLVEAFGNQLFIVTPPQPQKPGRSSGNLRQILSSQTDKPVDATTYSFIDTEFRHVAYTETTINGIQAVFSEWGDFFILNTDGKIVRYREKSLQSKLDILYSRNLYALALNIARRTSADASKMNQIHRKYADFLFAKGDYDRAMDQYIQAIESTEPSQVIRKFLDTQRIHNLIEFLEELHRHPGCASADHTTLLLNCYAKLKDLEKLESFLKSDEDLKYDLETAINMCRQGGYYEQAVFLAEKHHEHDTVLEIYVENLNKYNESLEYILRLPHEVTYKNLMRWARILLKEIPDEATNAFIEYYTGKYLPHEKVVVEETVEVQNQSSALQNYVSLLTIPYMSSNTATPQPIEQPPQPVREIDPANVYEPPKPRTAFSSFVDHPTHFITFLEACLEVQVGDESDRADLFTSLFEMYLHQAKQHEGKDRADWENKAKSIVEKRGSSIDVSNVLLLSHLSNFQDGTVLVREKQGLRFDIFRSYTAVGDTAGAIAALKKYGQEEPQLYPAALAYFTSDPKILAEAGEELINVLSKIDKDGLMAPLQVIQILSKNAVATMGMVRKYLSETIERERKEIQSNRRLISNYRTETETKKKEVEELGTKPSVFQTSRCSACRQQLDLPAVHFLCKHSFHQTCLNSNDDEPECPTCAANNATIKEIRRAQEETADRHDLFMTALEVSDNRFATMSGFFGRGVMQTPAQ